jgi:transketolase
MNVSPFVGKPAGPSAMLYSLLYLSGVKAMNPLCEQVGGPAVTLDNIKNFRQTGGCGLKEEEVVGSGIQR